MSPASPYPEYLEELAERKARGAFFTPAGVTEHLAEWAIRTPNARVLEPSAGEAAFLVAAVHRLRELGSEMPTVYGVELHEQSARVARAAIARAGGCPSILVSDFFITEARPEYDVVIGNPPFVRYQDFAGESRNRARRAASEQGVALSGLASSWAAFVVHSAAQLKPGGRLGMVLPAELLSVNYAAAVRRFLLERFASVELVVFDEQIFPDAEADTVLVKADGWGGVPGAATLRQTRNASTLSDLGTTITWAANEPGERWQANPLRANTTEAIASLLGERVFVPLDEFGKTNLGAVTGSNRFFALSPERVERLGIPRRDLVRISPPGSKHLRGLELSDAAMTRLGRAGEATWLLAPSENPATSTLDYLDSGVDTNVHMAYKCRVRAPWWRVPLLRPPDLFLTYMNADTPRMTTNKARARHLNSVHGVYLKEEYRAVLGELLPIASLNSLSLLGAEVAGRSYGGGILKMEPREADRWWMPSSSVLREHRDELVALKPRVLRALQARKLDEAVALVDRIILAPRLDAKHLDAIRSDGYDRMRRRTVRGRSG